MSSNDVLSVGVFATRPAAEAVVRQLLHAGFQKDEISVVCPACGDDGPEGVENVDPAGSHTAMAVTTGGAIGALLGGFTLVAGTAATGGLGMFVVGPLFGAAAAGGVAGGFLGAMATRGFEPEIADLYDQALREGQVLVAVHPEGDHTLEEADRILQAAGARQLHVREG